MELFINFLKNLGLAILRLVNNFCKKTYFYKKFSTKYLPNKYDKKLYNDLKFLSDRSIGYFANIDMGQSHSRYNIINFHNFVCEVNKDDFEFLNRTLEKKKAFFVESCDNFGSLMAKHLFIVNDMPHLFKVYPDLDRNNNFVVQAEKDLNCAADDMIKKFSEFIKAGKVIFADGVCD